jgi:hypothetical protein
VDGNDRALFGDAAAAKFDAGACFTRVFREADVSVFAVR